MTESLERETGAPAWARPEQAYAELFDGHFGGLVRLAHLLGADDPEDVAQEAFVQLHRKHRTLRDPGAALSYLRATVCNLSRSRLRRLRLARRLEPVQLPDAVPSAEQQVVSREDVRELLAALRELPGRQREVLVLRYWLDLTQLEVARTLGIAEGTVKSHIGRGLAALTRKLQEKR